MLFFKISRSLKEYFEFPGVFKGPGKIKWISRRSTNPDGCKKLQQCWIRNYKEQIRNNVWDRTIRHNSVRNRTEHVHTLTITQMQGANTAKQSRSIPNSYLQQNHRFLFVDRNPARMRTRSVHGIGMHFTEGVTKTTPWAWDGSLTRARGRAGGPRVAGRNICCRLQSVSDQPKFSLCSPLRIPWKRPPEETRVCLPRLLSCLLIF